MHSVMTPKRESLRRKLARLALCACAIWLACAQPAYAFYPIGFFSAEDNSVVLIRWPFNMIDRNGDGDVLGDQDGVRVTIDAREDGGFTNEEIAVIVESFNEWEFLPGSYMGFSFATPAVDPLIFGSADGISYFTLVGGADGVDTGTIAGLTLIQFVFEDTFVVIPGTDFAVEVKAGQVLDADIFIGANFRAGFSLEDRGLPFNPLSALKGVSVHEIGHFLGLDHTPNNNFREIITDEEDPEAGLLIEDAVMPIRDGFGQLNFAGITPTMYPIIFYTATDTNFDDGGLNLSLDDISGAHHLYPRQGQVDNYFDIVQEARTTAPTGFPSAPITGGLITAWVDHDNNAATQRLPLMSALSGQYTNGTPVGNPDIDGRIDFIGLPKELESITGTFFQATYTFTLTPFNGINHLGFSPIPFDSLHSFGPGVRETGIYDTVFQGEVFIESGNDTLGSIANATVMTYDPLRRQLVSVASGLTLDQIRPGQAPMFGTAINETICPLDIIIVGDGTFDDGGGGGDDGDGLGDNPFSTPVGFSSLSTKIRETREEWMAPTAVGRLAEDGYYRVAPGLARYLADRPQLVSATRIGMETGIMALRYLMPLLIAAAIAIFALRRRSIRRAAAILAIAAAMLFSTHSDAAQTRHLVFEELVSEADGVVTVTVEDVTSGREAQTNRILTHVRLRIDSVSKGLLNEESVENIRIIGGLDPETKIYSYAPGLAQFDGREGQRMLLFLRYAEDQAQFVVVAGSLGAGYISKDAETGKEYLQPSYITSKLFEYEKKLAAKSGDATAVKKTEEKFKKTGGLVPLDDVLEKVEDVAAQQKKAASDD